MIWKENTEIEQEGRVDYMYSGAEQNCGSGLEPARFMRAQRDVRACATRTIATLISRLAQQLIVRIGAASAEYLALDASLWSVQSIASLRPVSSIAYIRLASTRTARLRRGVARGGE